MVQELFPDLIELGLDVSLDNMVAFIETVREGDPTQVLTQETGIR